jgi:hypothetical protein
MSDSEPEELGSEPEDPEDLNKTDPNIKYVEFKYLSGERIKIVEFDPNVCVGKLASDLGLNSTKYGLQQVIHLGGEQKLQTTKLLPTDHVNIAVAADTYELYIVFLTEPPIRYINNSWAISWLCVHDSNSIQTIRLSGYISRYISDNGVLRCVYRDYDDGVRMDRAEMAKLLISIGVNQILILDLLYMKIDKTFIYEHYLKNNLLTDGLIMYLAEHDPDIEFARLFKDNIGKIESQCAEDLGYYDSSHFPKIYNRLVQKWNKYIGYENPFERAIRCGNFEFARWMSSIIQIPTSTLYSMLDVVRFSINNPKFDNCPDWIEYASQKFKFGDVIKYIIKNEQKLRYPALELIIRLIRVGCPITYLDMDHAILYNPNIAAYLGDNGYNLGSSPINYYIATNNWDIVEAGTAKIKYPITAQHFDIYCWPAHPMRIIATLPRYYNIELAKKVLELGCTWGYSGLTTLARKYGNDDFAKWAKENGCKIGPARARR